MMTLAACGGEDSDPKAGSAQPGGAAPTSAAAPAAPAVSDKELCESAQKLSEEMSKGLVQALQSANGDPSAAAFKKLLTDMEEKAAALAATGGDGKVSAALKQVAAESGKAAASADPAGAADNPAFAKAGTDLNAACTAAGVKVNF